jgi:serine O-acetyltransferase
MNLLDESLKNSVDALLQNDVPEYKYIPQPQLLLPNVNRIKEFIEIAKSALFPGFFGACTISKQAYYITLNNLYTLLNEQLYTALGFKKNRKRQKEPADLAIMLINRLPEIKRLLATDVKAVFESDPAAKSYEEVIFCYPAIQAMIHYRIAHELLLMDIPVLPRIITELAHSRTGIDINPGAQIGEYFSIDHGTGVVIGETCIIGNHVRLYQGVTLGAKSFTFDENGMPMNVPRHPILEDNVIVYSNSTILGRVTIGHNSIIGGNIWIVQSVPPYSRIVQQRATSAFSDGLGI